MPFRLLLFRSMNDRRVAGDSRNAPYLWIAPGVFLLLAVAIGFRRPGLQYDEALFEHGTVQMLQSGAEPPFAHDPGSWVNVAGRSWPLMVIPYVGAAQQYLLLPLFALLGPTPPGARVVGALLTAAGIVLLGKACSRWVPPAVAAASILIVAIHPDLLLTVLYDDGGFAQWTACLGLLAGAIALYARRRSSLSAFLLGAAAGLSVWCRSNFVWLLVPLALAVFLVYGRRAVPSRKAFALLVAGGIVGGLPLIVYEVLSRFATLRFLGAGRNSPAIDVPDRFWSFGESLLLDRTRAVIWGGELPPRAVLAALAAVVLGSLALLLFREAPEDEQGRVGRVAALTVIGYLLFVFSSGLNVVPHHFVAILPLEALVVALAMRRVAKRRLGRAVVAGLGLAYAIGAAGVIVSAARGIRATGGMRSWSDAIERTADVLARQYSRRDVYLLDWGFENNLFVLSNGALSLREMFWSSSDEGVRAGRTIDIDPDGVYVIRGPRLRIFPGASLAFLSRIRRGDLGFVRTRVFQRDGTPYADIYGIPGNEPAPTRITASDPSRIVAAEAFHLQSSGLSALAVHGSGFRQSDRICWNGRPLPTTFGSAGLISAEVPGRLFSAPGMARITIRRGNRIEPGAVLDIPIVAGAR